MRKLILGTAGHIDHGKTTLVRALTGVDTDRLKEEKERGITIDLGFAELPLGEDVRYGIVDVPGHEGFIRNMLAGATGMDVVLLVVAADEGVMPQTREHLAIVRLLGVDRLVVAHTKSDLVEEDWLELARDDVAGLLVATGFADAPIVATSSGTGQGLDELRDALARVGVVARERARSDLARLPVDRSFTVKGTGTVVTGTLWSGTLSQDERVHVLPAGLDARVRGLQVHAQGVPQAGAGERVAVALSGSGIEVGALGRGQVLTTGDGWAATEAITARISMLGDTPWVIERGQRVRVHLGTAEVMARAFVLDREVIEPGEDGWVQLRLEEPLVARATDRFVVRSYSPVTTIGGGIVAEPHPPRRTRLPEPLARTLETILEGDPPERVASALALAGWGGATEGALAVSTGLPPVEVERSLEGAEALITSRAAYSAQVLGEGLATLAARVDAYHREEPLRPGIPLGLLRQAIPEAAGPELADALLERLSREGVLEIRKDVVLRSGFSPELSSEAEDLRERLVNIYHEAGLTPPALKELPDDLRDRKEFWPLVRMLVDQGLLVTLNDEFFASADAVRDGARRVTEALGGKAGLGPADFRDVLPLTRKHLVPLLGYFDAHGVTIRQGDVREVPGTGTGE